MPRPSGEVILANQGLELVLLPKGSRSVTRRTITATIAAAVGDQTITLTSSVAGTVVKAGTTLSFVAPSGATDRQQIMTVDDVTIGTSNTVVNITGATKPILINSTASFVDGIRPLFGIQSFEISQSDTTVDTTNTQSGTGTEMASIRAARTFSISGIEIPNDLQLQEVKKISRSSAFFGREFFSVITYPDGEKLEGAAKISNYSQPGNQNEVKRYSFQLIMQGDVTWTAPYF